MSSFDEELDADPHGECREEIHMLQTENAVLWEEIERRCKEKNAPKWEGK